MKKISRITMLMGAVMVTLGLLAVHTDSVSAKESKEKKTIAEGVHIGSVDVSGMTSKEATAALDSYVSQLCDEEFQLVGAAGSVTATASQMVITSDTKAAVNEAMAIGHEGSLIKRYKDTEQLKSQPITVNMHLSVDKQETANYIYDNRDKLNIEAVDNTLQKTSSGFEFVEGTAGEEVNIVDSVYAINDFLQNGWDGSSNEISLVTELKEPRGSREELSQIKDVLGKFSTDFSTSAAGRSANVKNACSLINGHIVYPGEQFSVYEAISPISTDNGYALAGAYENGQVVESVGGGVCQVSTTLYNAVIRAELEVVQRYNHSMIVSYVSPSSDAAIAGTYKDFKFKNNTEYPIYINGYCSGGIINFEIYGVETRPSNRSVSFESETISETDLDVVYNLDASQPAGYYNTEQSAHKGVVAKLWKVVTVDGNVESRTEFNNSTYKPSAKVVTIGTAGASAEQLAAIQAAIDTKDDSQVKAACSAVAAAIANPTPETPQTPDTTDTGTTDPTTPQEPTGGENQ